jgi:hypothetical protein
MRRRIDWTPSRARGNGRLVDSTLLTLLTTESDAFRTMDDRREPLRGSLSYTYTHVARDLDFSATSKKGQQSS